MEFECDSQSGSESEERVVDFFKEETERIMEVDRLYMAVVSELETNGLFRLNSNKAHAAFVKWIDVYFVTGTSNF